MLKVEKLNRGDSVENTNKMDERELGGDFESLEIIKVIIYSLIGIVIFFVPIRLDNQTKTLIYHMSYKLQNYAGNFIKICTVVFVSLGGIKNIFISRGEKFNLKKMFIYIKLLSVLIIIDVFFGSNKVFLISDNTTLILKDIILNLITLLPLAAIFMVFFDYGLLDIVESYFHTITKKAFKLSGKTIVNILLYIFTDCFCGFYMTNRLYKSGKIRENEACMLVLNFSVLSIPMIKYIIDEFNIDTIDFLPILVVIFILSNMILSRVYPINKKKKSYYIKTSYKETVHRSDKLKKAIKKYINNRKKESIIKKIFTNLEEAIYVIMNVSPNIIIVLFLGDIIINNIGIIENIKYVFYPIINLLKLPYSNKLGEFMVVNFYNAIIAIDLIKGNEDYFIRILIGLVASLKLSPLSSLMVYCESLDFSISLKENVVSYLLKTMTVMLIYSMIYYFYKGYII